MAGTARGMHGRMHGKVKWWNEKGWNAIAPASTDIDTTFPLKANKTLADSTCIGIAAVDDTLWSSDLRGDAPGDTERL